MPAEHPSQTTRSPPGLRAPTLRAVRPDARASAAARRASAMPARGAHSHAPSAQPPLGRPPACTRRSGARAGWPISTSKDWITLKKQVLVSVDRAETRVALLEAAERPPPRVRPTGKPRRANAPAAHPEAGYRVAELYIERRGGRSIVGQHLQGQGRQRPARAGGGVRRHRPREERLPARRRDRAARAWRRPSAGAAAGGGRKITDLLSPGQEIVVQVVKDPLKTKGARLSMELTIAGRYMVYAPTGEGVGVSRRLEDRERERLRRQTAKLPLRGRRRDRPHRRPRRQARGLRARAEVPAQAPRGARASACRRPPRPDLVFQEADLSVRVVRDIFSAHFERAIVDDEQQYHRLVSFFTRTAPELVERVELWQEERAAVRGLRRRQGDRGRALAARGPAERRLPDHRLRRGADRDRRQLRELHRARQGRRAWRTRSPRPTSRPPRRSSTSCACATSAGSS